MGADVKHLLYAACRVGSRPPCLLPFGRPRSPLPHMLKHGISSLAPPPPPSPPGPAVTPSLAFPGVSSPMAINMSVVCAGTRGGVTQAESSGWADLMKLVQRACAVVTEDMPVDPDARDLQASQSSFAASLTHSAWPACL